MRAIVPYPMKNGVTFCPIWRLKIIEKMDAAQINKLVTSNAAPINSSRNNSIKLPCKKKVSNGVVPSRKQHRKIFP